jgi:hypothetical protein
LAAATKAWSLQQISLAEWRQLFKLYQLASWHDGLPWPVILGIGYSLTIFRWDFTAGSYYSFIRHIQPFRLAYPIPWIIRNFWSTIKFAKFEDLSWRVKIVSSSTRIEVHGASGMILSEYVRWCEILWKESPDTAWQNSAWKCEHVFHLSQDGIVQQKDIAVW